jgi:sugar phosphate permease
MLGLAGASVDGTYAGDVLVPFILLGFGLGPVIAALTALATDHVRSDEAGLASGVVNTAQAVGGAIGLAVLVSLANRTTEMASGGRPAALVEGFHVAFHAGAAISAASLVLAVLAVRRRDAPEPVAAVAMTPETVA